MATALFTHRFYWNVGVVGDTQQLISSASETYVRDTKNQGVQMCF